MERLFQLVERYCFQGHTHVPGVFTESFQFFAPEEIDNEYTLGDGKLMINVGSVGQPRDGDNRACYVILDDGRGGTATTEPRPDDRPTGPSPRHHLSPPALRLRDHDPEDLRHPRARAVPGRPAPTRTLVVHRAAPTAMRAAAPFPVIPSSPSMTLPPGRRTISPRWGAFSSRMVDECTTSPVIRTGRRPTYQPRSLCHLAQGPLPMSNEKRFVLFVVLMFAWLLGSRTF